MMIRSAALRLLNQPAPQQALLAVRQATTGERIKETLDGVRRAVQDATMQDGDFPKIKYGKHQDAEHAGEQHGSNPSRMKDTTRGVTEEDARRGPEGAQGETPIKQGARQAREQAQQTWDNTKDTANEGVRRAQETWDETKARAGEVREGASRRVDETTHHAQGLAEKAKEKVHEGWEKTKENVSHTVQNVKRAFGVPSGGPDEPSGPK